jgi:hypothetical protein
MADRVNDRKPAHHAKDVLCSSLALSRLTVDALCSPFGVYCSLLQFDLVFLQQAMADPEQALDYLEQQIPSLSAAAVDVAYWQALASGQAVLVSGDDGIYQAFADGTKKLIKTTEKPLSVPVGTRVRIP